MISSGCPGVRGLREQNRVWLHCPCCLLTSLRHPSVSSFGLTPGQIAKTAWVPHPWSRGRLNPPTSPGAGTLSTPPSATVQTPCSAVYRLRTLPCGPQRPPSVVNRLVVHSWLCDVIKRDVQAQFWAVVSSESLRRPPQERWRELTLFINYFFSNFAFKFV